MRTDLRTYEVTGEVLSLIPLRNRCTTPDGEQLVTRITEAMTRFECDGRTGIGMSDYLDRSSTGSRSALTCADLAPSGALGAPRPVGVSRRG